MRVYRVDGKMIRELLTARDVERSGRDLLNGNCLERLTKITKNLLCLLVSRQRFELGAVRTQVWHYHNVLDIYCCFRSAVMDSGDELRFCLTATIPITLASWTGDQATAERCYLLTAAFDSALRTRCTVRPLSNTSAS